MREGLGTGQRPELAPTRGGGARDEWEWVALPDAGGLVAILAALPVERQRPAWRIACWCVRPLAVLAFVSAVAVRAAAAGLLRAPAIMLRLGWAPVPSRAGDTARHRHPAGRQPEARPCHPTTVRDALRRSGAAAWAPAQRAGRP